MPSARHIYLRIIDCRSLRAGTMNYCKAKWPRSMMRASTLTLSAFIFRTIGSRTARGTISRAKRGTTNTTSSLTSSRQRKRLTIATRLTEFMKRSRLGSWTNTRSSGRSFSDRSILAATISPKNMRRTPLLWTTRRSAY